MTDSTSQKDTLKSIKDEIARVESQLACIVSKGYVISDVIPRDTDDVLTEEDLSWNNPLWDCLVEKKDALEKLYTDLKDLYAEKETTTDKSIELKALNERISSIENSALTIIYTECD